MSGIREIEKLNQRQLETIKRRNERELQTLAHAHELHKAETKKTHAGEMVELQNLHQNQIAEQNGKKEKVLAEMKNHLQQTKTMTEKELKDLKDFSARDKAEMQQKLTLDRERINAENELHLEETDYRYKVASSKIGTEGAQRIEAMKSHLHDEAREQSKFYQDKMNQQTNDFATRFKNDETKNRKVKDDQDREFKKERMTANVRQQTELGKMVINHNDQLETRDTNFRKGLKDQDLFFEKKFEKQLARHHSELKNLDDKNNKIAQNLKESLTKEITKTATRNEDPFYKFETLKPELKVLEDRVEVVVRIPEHSKEDMHLTINGKEAVLSFNRRYQDASKASDGTINKINKVETLTSRLQTEVILNPKSVKASYDNGIMTYVIKKA